MEILLKIKYQHDVFDLWNNNLTTANIWHTQPKFCVVTTQWARLHCWIMSIRFFIELDLAHTT